MIPIVQTMGQQKLQRPSITQTVILPSLDSTRNNGQFHLQFEFPCIEMTSYLHLKRVVTQFLGQFPQFQIGVNEMTWLVIWAAIENIRLKELEFGIFNLMTKGGILCQEV